MSTWTPTFLSLFLLISLYPPSFSRHQMKPVDIEGSHKIFHNPLWSAPLPFAVAQGVGLDLYHVTRTRVGPFLPLRV